MKDGGPAFPYDVTDSDGGGFFCQGMSLRDWFAGQALAGVVKHSDVQDSVSKEAGLEALKRAAKVAYLAADAMLKERDEARADDQLRTQDLKKPHTEEN